MLPCKLTDTEIKEKAQELSKTIEEKGELENELKAIKSQYKSSIDGQDSMINKLSNLIRSGVEPRTVEVMTVKDFTSSTITVIRSDTQEELESRDMTDEDRQRHMDFLEDVDKAQNPEEGDEAEEIYKILEEALSEGKSIEVMLIDNEGKHVAWEEIPEVNRNIPAEQYRIVGWNPKQNRKEAGQEESSVESDQEDTDKED
jgi:hypothetical protein